MQQAVVARRLGGDQVAGAGHYPQGHVDGIHAAVGDGHLGRIDDHAGITHADRHLPTQRFVTRAEHVAEGARAGKTGDLGQLLVQGADRQVVHVRHRRAEREYALPPRLGEHLIDDAAAGDQPRPLDPGDIRRRRGERRRAVHVIARLRTGADQALVLEGGVGLQHSCMTDVELGAQFPYRRHTLAWLVDAATNVLGELLGNALVQKQIGHGGDPSVIEPKQ
ncbi:hypothetical protein D9M71_115830 [compost metagenome]